MKIHRFLCKKEKVNNLPKHDHTKVATTIAQRMAKIVLDVEPANANNILQAINANVKGRTQ